MRSDHSDLVADVIVGTFESAIAMARIVYILMIVGIIMIPISIIGIVTLILWCIYG